MGSQKTRMQSLSRWTSGGPNVTIEYDTAGRKSCVFLGVPSPGAMSGEVARIGYHYDEGERLKEVVTSAGSGE